MGRIIIFLLISFFAVFAHAKPLTLEQVPEPLKPWVNWVLQDQPELGCPFIYNSYEQKRCSWPSQLNLDFTATKGAFSISWDVFKESWVTLPGDQKHWPQNVTANNKAATVLEKNGIPSIKLSAGSYGIKGDFFWDAIPESLSIPADTGLIGLSINGAGIPTPSIRDGQLWLTENDIGQKKPENVQNSLDIQVFRKITDDVPIQVTTRLVLEVSGEQREVKLAKPVLNDFIPLSLQSPLPARIEADGQLLVQVRPGRWQLDIVARSAKEINAVPLIVSNPDWPSSEIWMFDARPDLRVVEVEKLVPIDASQTNSPEEWRHLPTYKVNQGESMTLKVIRRGDPEPEPNQLTINRKLWLDFDGAGYTINDTISGKMTKGWRLDALPETKLGKVSLDGNSQLITLTGTGKQGVEVRKGAIALDADSRSVGDIGSFSTVGWEQSFNQVNAELNLPPGWRLLAASGVDNVPDSWIARWTLLDLFLVLIAALAISRLFGRLWGIFALLTLVLTWHEPESPQYVWLNILAATALIKVLPQGRFLTAITWYRNAFWLALVLIVVPFMVYQVRTGLYPQLEYEWQNFMMPAAPSPAPPVVMTPTSAMDAAAPEVLQEQEMAKSIMPERKRNYASGSVSQSSSYYSKEADFSRYDPDAKVQTGPGLPQWQWHKVQLSWNGSVDAGQQLRLWYLSPTVVMLLNFIRVALVAVLALLMFGWSGKLKFKPKTAAPALLWLLILPMLATPTQKAYADFPTKEVLDELKNRLLEAPDCLPSCAQIPQMNVAINENAVEITLQIHAQQAVNLPLPATYEQWFPNQATVDGKTAQGLYRNGNGLWLYLPEGEYQVVLTGAVPLLATFTLPLPLKPNRVMVETSAQSGWQVSGLQDNGQVDGQLQFNRTSKATESANKLSLAPGLLPPFVKIERTVQLGLDWRVITQITRMSPPDSAIVLEIPILAGELVTTPGIHVKNGKVEANMPAQQADMQWESTLEKAEKITFTAAQTNQWIEVWRADVSPVWHIETSGITLIHMNSEGQWLPEWHPWPGETLSLQISRPKTLEGQTLTIDSSQLAIKPGKRALDADLKMSIRSSQGTQHTLTLPEQAVLQTVAINGQTLPLRQEGRKLTLPINPGKQEVTLRWQEQSEISSITKTPQLDLGQASVNTRLNVSLGQDRWVLFVWGPKLGPAVLFWGVLVVIVILAIGLGKIPLTPLKNWHWFLLLLGLSQVPMESACLVVAWLMILGWRGLRPNNTFKYFNLLQVIIAMFTVFSLAILVFAVEQGLLGGSPNMQITGNQSSAFDLNWYQDRSVSTLPQATAISVPLMAYRLLMLAWSFWLAASLLNWLKWGWNCFSTNGLWNKKVEKSPTKPTSPEQK
ncbi:hypothetical protein [Methyloglobulus sp.]|uniref:hypothetical protein n=1 Tax=Methyloglobulus sp. TaxID=2518622 RepID=UPI0032B86364